jgi:Ca2+-binding EF-hand superfamily protein
MNQADIDEFTAVFNTFDRDHSGFINRKELMLCMTQCGFNVNKPGVTALIDKFDGNDDNKLSLEEFIQLAASLER